MTYELQIYHGPAVRSIWGLPRWETVERGLTYEEARELKRRWLQLTDDPPDRVRVVPEKPSR